MIGFVHQAKPRSAALLVSVYIDANGVPAWQAHVHRFKTPMDRERDWDRVYTPTAVMEIVRDWLESLDRRD